MSWLDFLIRGYKVRIIIEITGIIISVMLMVYGLHILVIYNIPETNGSARIIGYQIGGGIIGIMAGNWCVLRGLFG